MKLSFKSGSNDWSHGVNEHTLIPLTSGASRPALLLRVSGRTITSVYEVQSV